MFIRLDILGLNNDTAGNHVIRKFTQWTKCKQITAIFVELEVLFPTFLLTRAPYYRLDRPIKCGKFMFYELTKCLDSRLFRFRKHFNVLVEKSVALHTLQNMCPKSSNFESYYALICFLIQP